MNFAAIRSAVITYRPGEVLHFRGKSEPYGTVLSANGEEIWLSAPVVERGMVPRK